MVLLTKTGQYIVTPDNGTLTLVAESPGISAIREIDELPIRRWNSSPFCVDGGEGGREEAEGTTFLLPYWMARAFKLIGER